MSPIRAGPLLLMVLSLLSCRRLAIGDPGTDINVEMRYGQYEFTVQHCPKTRSSVPISWIKVVPKGPPELADDALAECEITWKSGAPLLTDRWIYGQTSAGYKRSRCVPLTRGKTYDVYANDSGHQRFEILEDGNVRVEKPICP